MQSTPPQTLPATELRLRRHGEGIEWEELPSLADSLAQRLVSYDPRQRIAAGSTLSEFELRFGSSWDNTLPASLDPAPQPEPFRETLRGLVMREVREPEVFRHFFGAARR
jgi:hypothetical protein